MELWATKSRGEVLRVTDSKFWLRSTEVYEKKKENKETHLSHPHLNSFIQSAMTKRRFTGKTLRTLRKKTSTLFRLQRDRCLRKRQLKPVTRQGVISEESYTRSTVDENLVSNGRDVVEGEAASEVDYQVTHHDENGEEIDDGDNVVALEDVEKVLEKVEAMMRGFTNLAIRSSMPCRPQHGVNSRHAIFLPFPRLPTELRLIIWVLSLPKGRIIPLNSAQFRLFREGEDLLLNVSYAPSQPPHLTYPNTLNEPTENYLSLSATNQESRTVFLEKFKHIVPIRCYYNGTRYFGSSDTIYLESVPYDLENAAVLQTVELGHKPGSFFENVTQLALNVNAFDNTYLFGSLFPQPLDNNKISVFNFLKLFSNLEVLTIFGASSPWDEEYDRTMVAICESGFAELRESGGDKYMAPRIVYEKPEFTSRENTHF